MLILRVAVAVAKWSLGLFLLRIVLNKYQRIAIWSTMIILLLVSFQMSVVFWIQHLPAASIFDHRVHGSCVVNIKPFLWLLGSK